MAMNITRTVPATAQLLAPIVSSYSPDTEVDVGAYQLGAGVLAAVSTEAEASPNGLIIRGIAATGAAVSGFTARLAVLYAGAGSLVAASTEAGDSINYTYGQGVALAAVATMIGAGQAGTASTGQVNALSTMRGDADVFPSGPPYYRLFDAIPLIMQDGMAGTGSVMYAGNLAVLDAAATATARIFHAMHLAVSDAVAFCGKTVLGQDQLSPEGVLITPGSARISFSVTPDLIPITLDLITQDATLLPLTIYTDDDDVTFRFTLLEDGQPVVIGGGDTVLCVLTQAQSPVPLFPTPQEPCSVIDADNGIVEYLLPLGIAAAGPYVGQVVWITNAGLQRGFPAFPFTVSEGL